MALTTYKVNDSAANSRKKPLEAWRRLQKRYVPTTGGRKQKWLRTIFWMVLSVGTPSRNRTTGILCVALQENLDRHTSTMRFCSLAWKALMLEELDKYLTHNANRLRTFEGCAPGNRDVCGGEVLFERPRFQAK